MKIRKLLDSIWLEIVKFGKSRCELCGETCEHLNAHHLISRAVLDYRWEPLNAAILCAGCHTFKINAVHVSPWVLLDNLEILLGKQRAEWFNAHKFKLDNPAPDISELCEIYKKLDLEYYKTHGIHFKKNLKL